ncbi:DUF402 domain-containing protein [Paenibacillus sp. HJGM_3]|uniref:DUF402 domain-containing protein n=1 Tax=Paenibacillus sp. HJGM_3 TaxID=3379816 RepID=UPI003859EDB9
MKQVNTMLERKIKYDGSVVDYECILLEREDNRAVLFYPITKSFSVAYGAEDRKLILPNGSYTIAYYWTDRPYNVYVWRDAGGTYIGAYFNIVRNTVLTETEVSFEDLIVDVLLLPAGERYVLDEEELPEPLEEFEEGLANRALHSLLGEIDLLLPQLLLDSESFLGHEAIRSHLDPIGR